ncbi:hypothetical protein Daura_32420 [Dactylosporangium aurantiacum]|uniref:Uncharacterized protein n=1 Tax=Dactylosporangium aurantiacum TaxID=35754 RepID=A0A9Q9ICF1_9ACTN|nr:hypothetical protein [Dactylosporangium aurantiacum]MDG6107146.1 hypothetical protein [Dactylosporangium aurantiacum]UWZ51442.1 hypothetical protein Daura_32420 [Dactylosporangium aurantiacum]
MPVRDVHLLALHEPYHSPRHPVPINGTIVHALTLLHPAVPQPDGGHMYRCLTEFPGRTEGCLVPLSTLTYELDGGRLWDDVADWEYVVDVLVELTRAEQCDAMHLGLPDHKVTMLVNGPETVYSFIEPDGGRSMRGPADRQREVDELTGKVHEFVARGGPFWPGNGLVPPPSRPVLPWYRPATRH